jgi:DNA gyrase subunit A
MASLRVVRPGDGVMIATANGIVVRQETDKISAQGRMATGVRIQQLGEEDQVVSVTPLVEPIVDVDGVEGDVPPADGEAQD